MAIARDTFLILLNPIWLAVVGRRSQSVKRPANQEAKPVPPL